jgi:hypothetical protein
MLAYQKQTRRTMLRKDYGGKFIRQTYQYSMTPDIEADTDGVRDLPNKCNLSI